MMEADEGTLVSSWKVVSQMIFDVKTMVRGHHSTALVLPLHVGWYHSVGPRTDLPAATVDRQDNSRAAIITEGMVEEGRGRQSRRQHLQTAEGGGEKEEEDGGVEEGQECAGLEVVAWVIQPHEKQHVEVVEAVDGAVHGPVTAEDPQQEAADRHLRRDSYHAAARGLALVVVYRNDRICRVVQPAVVAVPVAVEECEVRDGTWRSC